jgi:hypothetical protein
MVTSTLETLYMVGVSARLQRRRRAGARDPAGGQRTRGRPGGAGPAYQRFRPDVMLSTVVVLVVIVQAVQLWVTRWRSVSTGGERRASSFIDGTDTPKPRRFTSKTSGGSSRDLL